MSSDASRNNTRGVMLRVAKSLRTQSRSPVNPRERTSITTASWVIREPAARPSSTIRAINSGGRLSATYQPRSSSTFAAVPRPAPDRPVTRTTSMPARAAWSAVLRHSCRLVLQILAHRPARHRDAPCRSLSISCSGRARFGAPRRAPPAPPSPWRRRFPAPR